MEGARECDHYCTNLTTMDHMREWQTRSPERSNRELRRVCINRFGIVRLTWSERMLENMVDTPRPAQLLDMHA